MYKKSKVNGTRHSSSIILKYLTSKAKTKSYWVQPKTPYHYYKTIDFNLTDIYKIKGKQHMSTDEQAKGVIAQHIVG